MSQPIKVVVVVVPVTDDDVVIAVAVVVVDVVIIISHRTRYLPLKFGSVTAEIFLLLLMLWQYQFRKLISISVQR